MALKLFQTRIYAQAFTVAALCGAAAITAADDTPSTEEVRAVLVPACVLFGMRGGAFDASWSELG